MHTLIVDDDLDFQYVFSLQLKAHGDVECTSSFDEALLKFRSTLTSSNPFDIVFVDILMPNEGGLEVIHEIRKVEKEFHVSKAAQVTIVVITGLDMNTDVRNMLEDECELLITKPLYDGHIREFTKMCSEKKSLNRINAGSINNFEKDKVKILIVDDDKVCRLAAKMSFNHLNCELMEAEDGEEAVSLAANHDFDLICMDIQMPVLNGIEAMKKIKEKNSSIPIIACTSQDIDDVDDLLAFGFDDFISKPISNSRSKKIFKNWLTDHDIDYENLSEENLKILIVDDESDVVRILKALLIRHCECDTAENGEIGLKMFDRALAEGKGYHQILLDIDMPKLNGVEMMKQIRQLEAKQRVVAHRAVKIIVETAHNQENWIADAIEKYSNDSVQKPFDNQNVVKKILMANASC